MAREDCVFPYEYFDAVLSNQHKREWDFFGLCGCPTSLAKIVMQLARLAAERQRLSQLSLEVFDDSTVADIEQALHSWHYVSTTTAFRDEDTMHRDQDIMHCSEAWRTGLLLYIFRVFRWKPGHSIPMYILYQARVVIDHIVACRTGDMVSRQALLPLFFAACELKDHSIRTGVLKFCATWDERTNYHMFRGTIPLLEEVWDEQDKSGNENVWWGQIVDKRHSSSAHPLRMQICFG